jgi:hypothetical protein
VEEGSIYGRRKIVGMQHKLQESEKSRQMAGP